MMHKIFACLFTLSVIGTAAITCGCRSMAETYTVFNVYGSHMVLQREKPLVFQGSANPGQWVNVKFAGKTQPVRTAASGIWRAEFPAMNAGGPYKLQVSGAPDTKAVVYDDILIGDVWIKAGKPEDRILPPVKHNAPVRSLRVRCVPRPAMPLEDLASSVPWTDAGSADASGIPLEPGVPAGIIKAQIPVNGTAQWISLDALKHDARKPELEKRKKILTAIAKRYAEKIRSKQDQKFLDAFFANKKKAPDTTRWKMPSFNDSDWTVSKNHCTPPSLDGVFWFRKKITIPDGWTGKSLQLDLGLIADSGEVFFNGVMVGFSPDDLPEFYARSRIYTIPGPLVKPGKAVVAVRVIDYYGVGGMYSPYGLKLTRFDLKTSSVSLDGDWKMKAEFLANVDSDLIFFAAGATECPSALYNGVIAPLTKLPVRGICWSAPDKFKDFNHLIYFDWKKQWNDSKLKFIGLP